MAQTKTHTDNAARQKAWRTRQAERMQELSQTRIIPAASAIETLPSRARWSSLLTNGANALTAARDSMQEYYDARSEVWQEGDNAERMQETIDTLEELINQIAALTP